MLHADELPSTALPDLARWVEGPGGLLFLQITTPSAEAEICLQGAHVTRFQPTGAAPVLWLSRASRFATGQPIRGGVPVCFPWFAGREGRPDLPAHGFARTRRWEPGEIAIEADGGLKAVFALEDDATSRALWPRRFRAEMHVRVGQALELDLSVENCGSEAFTFESALHSYLALGDVRSAAVIGLEGTEYLDKVDGNRRKRSGFEPVRFTSETDRVFVNTSTDCVLEDPDSERRIHVGKSGSNSTVVWNPWVGKAAALADFGDDEWPGTACIETANVGENAVALPAGATHRMTARIAVERLQR